MTRSDALAEFKPQTIHVIDIAVAPEVWQALTDPACTTQYFFDRVVEIEPKAGGRFILRMADGAEDVQGKMVQ